MHTSDPNARALLTPWTTCLQVRATCEGLRQASSLSTVISLLLLRRVGSSMSYLHSALPVQILPRVGVGLTPLIPTSPYGHSRPRGFA